jgi:hypothetical protein
MLIGLSRSGADRTTGKKSFRLLHLNHPNWKKQRKIRTT